MATPEKTLDYQQVAFYFALNELTEDQLYAADNAREENMAFVINQVAWERLLTRLPELPEWQIDDRNLSFSPYELCGDSMETVNVDGVAAFSQAVTSQIAIPEATLLAMQAAFVDAYTYAAQRFDWQARYLHAELRTEWRLQEQRRLPA